jgi:DNA (cytosine-5)-methyltransferase 1
MAGVPDDEPVWTGSCPCQPFSVAGKRRGTNDERHLWPEFHRLIAEFRPARVYGEQVASRDALAWLDGVRADLENEGYAVGAANLCAAGVAAPSIRQRTYWFADRDGEGGPRLESRGNPGSAGPWGWRGKEDLRAITDAPHVATDRWPQPIVRKMDDGIPARVGRLRAYGNAIVPQVAAAFVRATL